MADAPTSFWHVVGALASGMTAVLALVGGVGGIIIGDQEREIADLKGSVADLTVRMAPLLTLYAQHTSDKEQAAGMLIAIDNKVGLPEYHQFDRTISDRVTAAEASSAARNSEVIDQLHKLENRVTVLDETQVRATVVDALTLRVNDLSRYGACAK